MKRRILLFLGMALLVMPSIYAVARIQGDLDPPTPDELLEQTVEKIGHILHEIDGSLEIAQNKLLPVGIEGEDAQKIVWELYDANEYAFDCTTIDPKGIIRTVAPEEYTYLVGMNISDQQQFLHVMAAHEPVMSTAIDTLEGFVGFDFERPVFNGEKKCIGSVSTLTKPDFFRSIILKEIGASPVEVRMIQKDGRIIYDRRPEEIGHSVFDSICYRESVSFAESVQDMIAVKEGRRSYTFFDKGLKENVRKELIWKTVGLYGTELRVALAYLKEDFE